MTTTANRLKEVIERAESWPEEAQEQLAEMAREIEEGLKPGFYEASPEELAGIDLGLKDAREERFASEAEVQSVFAKFRSA